MKTMNLFLSRWLDALPPQLRPRGIRYQAAGARQGAILHRRRIFVLPSRQGVIFTGVLFLMLLGAINYGNSMAFVLSFWLGSLLPVSILFTYRNLVGLEVKPGSAEPCFTGGHALFHLHLNNSQARERCDIEIRSRDGSHSSSSVAPLDHAVVTLALPARQRGRLKPGRITLATRYPLGLFRAWAYVDLEAETLVYPRPADHAPLPQGTSAMGERRETSEQGSDDFHGLRDYHPGDSPRHIDWKALAREQGMVTKQFQRHQSPELWFDWDETRGADVEIRLSQLCRWLLDADSQQQRYGLRLPGTTLPPAQGSDHLSRCLAQLALFGEAP
jgi:uncharacterized protein (DUF58 family)